MNARWQTVLHHVCRTILNSCFIPLPPFDLQREGWIFLDGMNPRPPLNAVEIFLEIFLKERSECGEKNRKGTYKGTF